jgi:hypothetical protein
MKIALYVEDGLEQIVLTPQSDTEKALLGKLHDGSRQFTLKKGSFYGCQGGWVRHQVSWRGTFDSHDRDDESTMIILRKPEQGAEDAGLGEESEANERTRIPNHER